MAKSGVEAIGFTPGARHVEVPHILRHISVEGISADVDDDMLVLEPGEMLEHDPFGDSWDWEEARIAGIHMPSGYVTRERGDSYWNDRNGSHVSSSVGGLMLAGYDLDSLDGLNDASH